MSIDFRHLTDRLERIHDKAIALRPVCIADAWPLFDATRNPLFNRHLLWPAPEAQPQVTERLDAMIAAMRAGRLTALSAVVRDTGEWVSLFRFMPVAADPRALEMGIWTHPRFWNGRASLVVGRLCVGAAFEASDAACLIGQSAIENRGSCRLMQAVGLVPTGVGQRPKEDGGFSTFQAFAITRAQWLAARQPRAVAAAEPLLEAV